MDVTLPNGVVIKGVPDDATKDQIRAKAIKSGLATPEDFKSVPKLQTSTTPAQKPYLGQQYIEPALNMVSNVVAPIAAGAMAVPSIPFIGMEGANEVMGDMRDRMTYEPRLDESKENIETLKRGAMDVMTGTPQGRLAYLAMQSQMDHGQNIADQTADRFGPIAGTIARTIPTAVGEATGLGVINRMRPSMRLLDDMGVATPQLERLSNSKQLTPSEFTAETRALVPTEVNPGLIRSAESRANDLAGDMQVRQIESGGRDSALAPYRVEGGRTRPDPVANEAIKNGWRDGTVQMIKTSNPETKRVMNKMLEMRWAILRNESNASKLFPMNAVGDAFYERIKFITDKAKEARRGLERISRSPQFKQTQVDVRPIVQTLRAALDDLRITYKRAGDGISLNYKDSVIEVNKKAQKAINQALQLIRPDRPVTADSVHLLKRQLDDLIDFKRQSQGGISESGRNVLKGLRHQTNQVLRNSIPEYAEVNDVLSSVLQTMDEFKNATKLNLNMFDDPSGMIGQEMRKLHTNYKSRGVIEQAAARIDQLANDMGGNFNTNYSDLSQFANRLDERFGSSKSGDFQGKNEAADMAASYVTEGTPGAIRSGVNAVKNRLMRSPEDEFKAYQSLKSLINR